MLKSAMVLQLRVDGLPVLRRFDSDNRKKGNTIVLATILCPPVEAGLILGWKLSGISRERTGLSIEPGSP